LARVLGFTFGVGRSVLEGNLIRTLVRSALTHEATRLFSGCEAPVVLFAVQVRRSDRLNALSRLIMRASSATPAGLFEVGTGPRVRLCWCCPPVPFGIGLKRASLRDKDVWLDVIVLAAVFAAGWATSLLF